MQRSRPPTATFVYSGEGVGVTVTIANALIPKFLLFWQHHFLGMGRTFIKCNPSAWARGAKSRKQLTPRIRSLASTVVSLGSAEVNSSKFERGL